MILGDFLKDASRISKILRDAFTDYSRILKIFDNSLKASPRIPKNLKESQGFTKLNSIKLNSF